MCSGPPQLLASRAQAREQRAKPQAETAPRDCVAKERSDEHHETQTPRCLHVALVVHALCRGSPLSAGFGLSRWSLPSGGNRIFRCTGGASELRSWCCCDGPAKVACRSKHVLQSLDLRSFDVVCDVVASRAREWLAVALDANFSRCELLVGPWGRCCTTCCTGVVPQTFYVGGLLTPP